MEDEYDPMDVIVDALRDIRDVLGTISEELAISNEIRRNAPKILPLDDPEYND